MFRWYKNAVICYAYLTDVPKNLCLSAIEKELFKSRWFTRGWTLQELIAPSEVVFYSMDWHQVGTKSELSLYIAGITNIEEIYLDAANLEHASVAQRMSWAARRETSRDEDLAYCLLGIFDVNMPLIYGEGPKAFQRLQEEIMKAFPEDHTLFAWGTVVQNFSKYAKTEAQVLGDEEMEWERSNDDDYDDDEESLLGFLAESPRDFEQSGRFVCYREAKKFFRRWDFPLTAPAIIGRTMRLDLPVLGGAAPFAVYHLMPQLPIARLRSVKTAVLVCGRQDEETLEFQFVTVPLLICTGGYYGRTREIVVNSYISLPRVNYDILGRWRNQLVVERQPRYLPRTGDIILRRFVTIVPCATSIAVETVDVAIDDGFIKALAPTQGRIACLTFEYNDVSGFGLHISRVGGDEEGTGNLHFAIMPVDLSAQGYVPEAVEVGEDKRGLLEEIKEEDGKGEEGNDSVKEEEEEEGKGHLDEDGEQEEEEEDDDEWEDVEDDDDEEDDDKEEPDTAHTLSSQQFPKPSPTPSPTSAHDIPPAPPYFRDTREAYYHFWDHWEDAPYTQTMALPTHTWEVPETRQIPRVRITAHRMYIDHDPAQPVDVLDVVITSSWSPSGQLPEGEAREGEGDGGDGVLVKAYQE